MIDSTVTIGITGNIATGKSVIRRMLANAGVFGIDADGLANRMIYPGGRAYQQVIQAFGPEIKSDQHTISNKKLGQIVFNDPERMHQLEALIHPPVIEIILKRIRATQQPVASIEAIKLLESGLGKYCDQIWVSHASFSHQMRRLRELRGLTEDEARARITAQSPQIEKLSAADVIINTETSFKDTWLRTRNALNDTIQSVENSTRLHLKISQDWSGRTANTFPADQLELSWEKLTGQDQVNFYEHIGMEMVLTVMEGQQIRAFIIWENWNFTATLKRVYPADFMASQSAVVYKAFEKHAHTQQTEILLLDADLVGTLSLSPEQFGYDHLHSEDISYPAWQIAARKATKNGRSKIWQKVLAQPYEIEATLNT